jgi:hypothetical protein
MKVIGWHGAVSAQRHAVRSGAGILVSVMLVAAGLGGPAQVLGDASNLLAATPVQSTAQVQGMAGYVLNAETNMNTVYTRKLNRELMNPPNNGRIDDSPVIQYQGPPPQPLPNGPLFQKPTSQGSVSH